MMPTEKTDEGKEMAKRVWAKTVAAKEDVKAVEIECSEWVCEAEAAQRHAESALRLAAQAGWEIEYLLGCGVQALAKAVRHSRASHTEQAQPRGMAHQAPARKAEK